MTDLSARSRTILVQRHRKAAGPGVIEFGAMESRTSVRYIAPRLIGRRRASDIKFAPHHSLFIEEALLRCPVSESLSRPGVELGCDCITASLGKCLLIGSLGEVLA